MNLSRMDQPSETGTDQEDTQVPRTVIEVADHAGDNPHPDPEGGRQDDTHTGQDHDQDERQQEETVEEPHTEVTEIHSGGDEHEQHSRTQITRLEQSTIVVLLPLQIGLES
ncbi:hypothetical protein F2Q70_00026520 [Brassica cretica]|uniref:Uncharacterized protein n=1 Tax=Brassica cretica TaxID=69181 RepID=A0A8S9LEH1_BRACR|nr:hypothetical protein F2Q70_00026520 [Brassica cretica]